MQGSVSKSHFYNIQEKWETKIYAKVYKETYLDNKKKIKCKSSLQWFFLSGFSFTDTGDLRESSEREEIIFSPLNLFQQLTNIQTLTSNFIHVRWLLRIFRIYQIATRRGLPPSGITISSIVDDDGRLI